MLSLCVIGIPAYAGTAIADVTPGTISNLILFFFKYSASSPPLPKSKGSPPFNLTIVLNPDLASETSFLFIWFVS